MKKMCVCYQKSERHSQEKNKNLFFSKIFNINFIYKKNLEIISFNQFINLFLFSINQLMENFSRNFQYIKSPNLDAKIHNLDAKFAIFYYFLPQLRRQDPQLRRQDPTGSGSHV